MKRKPKKSRKNDLWHAIKHGRTWKPLCGYKGRVVSMIVEKKYVTCPACLVMGQEEGRK